MHIGRRMYTRRPIAVCAKGLHSAAAAKRAVGEESLVLTDEEMRLHDAQRIERNAHNDEERRAA